MTGTGIIGLEISRHRQSRRLDLGFFLMKESVVFRQQVVELPRRHLNPPILHLRQQHGLRDVRVIVLVQKIAHQLGAVIATVNCQWHRGRHTLARREPPLLQQVTGIVGADLHLLHHIPSISLEPRPVRYPDQRDRAGFVNDPFRRLCPARTPTTRAGTIRHAGSLGVRSAGRFQGVRFQQRTRWTTLQPSHLIRQSLDLLLLFGDELQQTPHQGRLLALGDLRQFGFEPGNYHSLQYGQVDHHGPQLPAVNENLPNSAIVQDKNKLLKINIKNTSYFEGSRITGLMLL